MNLNSILCVCLAGVTLTLGNQTQDGVQANGHTSYEFGYDIHNPLSNDMKSHHEIRDGKNVIGYYTFREADGSIRMVKYRVTPETGFEAVVEKLPDPLSGNSIDGQEAAPSNHGVPQTVNQPNAGANSQYAAANHNPRPNVVAPPPQVQQVHAQAPLQHHHPGGYKNPHVIQQNPHVIPNHQQYPQYPPQKKKQKFVQETSFLDLLRSQKDHIARKKQLQREKEQQRQAQGSYRNNLVVPQVVVPQVQPQEYVAAPNQPSGRIVYIDGVAYIDDIGLYSDPKGNGELVLNPQFQIVRNEDATNEVEAEIEEDAEETDSEEELQEFLEEDDDDEEVERLLSFEDGEEDDDEDPDETEFYNENEKMYKKQQEQYALMKKAFEEDGEQPRATEQQTQQEEEAEEEEAEEEE